MRAVILACLMVPAAAAQTPPPALTCQVLIDPVEFGTYNAISRSPNDSAGRIEVRCLGRSITPGARVTLSTGSSGRYQERTLLHGADTLRYNLYVDPGRRNIAGDGTEGTHPLQPVPADTRLKTFRGGLLAAARAVFRIYGRIDPGQSIPAGDYADNIQVIVEF
jgi:spore coat protein U-like protein